MFFGGKKMEKETKNYESPAITVLRFDDEDVIRTSGGDDMAKGEKWNWTNVFDNIWED